MIDINAIHATIASLRELGTDTQDVEVKAAFGGLPKELPETISAFANGNGGLLILGLDENNNFATSHKFQLLQTMTNPRTSRIRECTVDHIFVPL